jgi:glycosyltransferase involved in cell wall biosynthesis
MPRTLAGSIVSNERLSNLSGSLNLAHTIERRNRLFPRILFSEQGLVPAEEILYSPHGRDLPIAEEGRCKTPSDKIRFGFTGQIVPHKGADTLVEAFNRLPQDLPVELHMYGDPKKDPAAGDLVALAGDNPAVVWHGPYSHADAGCILQNIDVVVVPSNCIENDPGPIAEAYAAGTPVIGSDVCGVREHIRDGISGLLFERNNSADLARKISWIATEEGLLERLRSGVVAPKSMESNVEELIAIYGRLCRNQVAGHPHSTANRQTV